MPEPIPARATATLLIDAVKPDRVLRDARRAAAALVAAPFLFVNGAGSVSQLRRAKMEEINAGVDMVLRIQQIRNYFLDQFFPACSFFAEEEFYLIALPFLLWNVDGALTRHLSFVVCIGLCIGNAAKDVFRLPRPRHPDLWVPHAITKADNTGCKDFGFPSTHAMNSVSNSLFLILYTTATGTLAVGSPSFFASCAGAAMWCTLISFSRLYTGVHSLADVKAGLGLGVFMALSWFAVHAHVDDWILGTPYLLPKLALLMVLAVTVIPRDGEQGVSYQQSCLLLGLMWGCAFGVRVHADGGLMPTKPWLPQHLTNTHALYVTRLVVGYLFVLVVRAAAKAIMSLPFRSTGKPVRLPGLAKCVVYAVVAFAITAVTPALLAGLGL